MTTRPGWYPDPSGRFPKRWHDGFDWTASVLDDDAQQGFDRLPPAGAPAVASPSAPAGSPPPQPPPSTAPPPPGAAAAPATPSPWAAESSWQRAPSPPAAASAPSAAAAGSWQPGQAWRTGRPQTAQPYTPTTSGGVWAQQQQPVTTASLGLTPPPAARSAAGARSVVVYGLVALGIAGLVLSMFVLDWYSEAGASAGFRDFGDGSIGSGAPFLDKLAFWFFKWLGFVVAAVALVSVILVVVARAVPGRVGHVLAAIVIAIGVLLSTFAIVRLGRNVGEDPDAWAWLLPAGYFVLLTAVVFSARDESA